MRRTWRQVMGCGAATLVAVAAMSGEASAHVTLTSLGPVRAGSFSKIGISVPNERPDAGTVKLAVQLPKDHVLAYVSVQPKPGWEIAATTRTLDPPLEGEGGSISEVVDSITWTASGDTQIAPGQFDLFWISVGVVPTDATELVFPAIQTYSSGEEVAWVQPSSAGAEPEHPAPTVAVVATTTDGATATTGDNGGRSGLTVVALIVAFFGAAFGASGLIVARTARRLPAS